MKNVKVVITALAMVLAVSGWAYAQNPQPAKGNGEKGRQEIFKQLNLTEAQQKQLTDNRQAESQKMAQVRQAMRDKQQQLQQALRDPTVTREKVQPLVNEIKTLQAQTIDSRIDGIFAVKQILTPEQYAKFNQIMEEKQKEMRQGWEGKAKGPGGNKPGEKPTK